MSRYQHINLNTTRNHEEKKIPIGRFLLLFFLVFILWKCWNPEEKEVIAKKSSSSTAKISSSQQLSSQEAPRSSSSSPSEDSSSTLKQWALQQPDTNLAFKMGVYLERYHPVGALYLMVDGKTNEILAYGQYSDSTLQKDAPWLHRGSFPAASLIKTMSAATALESGRYSNHSRIPMKGSYHTLYKSQLNIPKNFQGETLSLEMAYAKSANPTFGIIGNELGGEMFRQTALKMGFNREIPHQDTSFFKAPLEGFGLAEAASGFTQSSTLTPLLAAAQVRSILMGKPLQMPYLPNDTGALAKQAPLPNSKLKDNTYFGLRKMMQTTSQRGTSSRLLRKHMYRYVRKKIVTGSKTGTLDGEDPKGRYDWFVGFAHEKDNVNNSVVIVILQIYDDFRTLRSSAVAGLLLNDWEKYILSERKKED